MTFTIDDIPLDVQTLVAISVTSVLTLLVVLFVCLCTKLYHCISRIKKRGNAKRNILDGHLVEELGDEETEFSLDGDLIDMEIVDEDTESTLDGELEEMDMSEFVGPTDRGQGDKLVVFESDGSTKEDPGAEKIKNRD